MTPAEVAVDVDALDKLREAIRDVLAGWPIGSGYYSTTVGTNDAREMTVALLTAALPDLLAEVRRGRALREAVEKLIAFYDRHEYSTLNVDDLRAVLAAVDPS